MIGEDTPQRWARERRLADLAMWDIRENRRCEPDTPHVRCHPDKGAFTFDHHNQRYGYRT